MKSDAITRKGKLVPGHRPGPKSSHPDSQGGFLDKSLCVPSRFKALGFPPDRCLLRLSSSSVLDSLTRTPFFRIPSALCPFNSGPLTPTLLPESFSPTPTPYPLSDLLLSSLSLCKQGSSVPIATLQAARVVQHYRRR